MTRWLALACATLAAGCAPTPAPFRAAASSSHVLFVQLGGDVLQGAATDDATTGHSAAAANAPSGVAYVPAFDANVVAPGVPATDVADVLFDRVRTLFGPWDVTLTRTRPSSGAYTEIAVGGSYTLIGANEGVAGLTAGTDCTDANPSNVGYDFSNDQSPDFGGVVTTALTAAHEAGHAYGLEHTDDVHDVMYVVATPMQTVADVFGASFGQTGAYSSFGAGGLSKPESCGRADPVNAGVLMTNVGPSTRADTTPPTLSFQPPGSVVPQQTFTASATDDVGVTRMELYKNFALVAIANGSSLSATIGAANGESYYVTVDAIDATANRASATQLVTAYVADAGVDFSDGFAPVDASVAVDAGGFVASGGCSFAARAPSGSALALLLMGSWLAATYRRRRRATTG
jgi:hypothetical protein